MESFYSLLCCMGFTSDSSRDGAVDIVGMLPPEIAIMILRNLDGPSLLAASRVSSRWLSLVQSDGALVRRLSRQMKVERRQREARVFAAGSRPLRTPRDAPKPLAHQNGRFTVARPDNGAVQLLAAPLGVHKAVKRKNSSSLQSAMRRFAADLRGKPKATAQPVKKAMRL